MPIFFSGFSLGFTALTLWMALEPMSNLGFWLLFVRDTSNFSYLL
jgi:hypothetical protein